MAILVNSSPGRRNDFLDLQRGNEPVAVTLVLDVKTRWSSTLTMLERSYRLRWYTRKFLEQDDYSNFRGLYLTDQEWKVVEYLMEILRPFRYWTMWMSMRRQITLHRVLYLYDDMLNHIDSVLKVLKNKKYFWKCQMHDAMRAARNKLKQYYEKITPAHGQLLVIAAFLDPYRRGRLFKIWDGTSKNHRDELIMRATEKDIDESLPGKSIFMCITY